MHRIIASNQSILSSIVPWLFVVTLSACSGPGSSLGSTANLPQSKTATPLTSASPTPIPFNFTTVDDPNSAHNEVTGINERAKIVGTYGVGSQSNIPNSYTSQAPYTKLRPVNYPGGQGTVATSISSTRTIGGYVIDPNGLNGISGLLQINGLANLVVDPNEAGSYPETEILGVNDSGTAVGFYTNSANADVPFQLNISQDTFTDLTPPGAPSAQATGINNKGNITGIETSSSGVAGFYLRAGTYYQIVHPGASATEALGLNHSEQVVGFYVGGGGGKTHGFILTGPTNGGDQQIWQTVDEPNADTTTVITGINNHDAICGYYTDASGTLHGFVATVKTK